MPVPTASTAAVTARAAPFASAPPRSALPAGAESSASLLDPVSYLTGRLPVTAVGVLKTNNGVGQMFVEGTTVGGVPVPKLLAPRSFTLIYTVRGGRQK